MKHDAILRKHTPAQPGVTLWGDIHEDSKGRFEDGTFVRTTMVQQIVEDKDGKFAVTKNTIYKLEE